MCLWFTISNIPMAQIERFVWFKWMLFMGKVLMPKCVLFFELSTVCPQCGLAVSMEVWYHSLVLSAPVLLLLLLWWVWQGLQNLSPFNVSAWLAAFLPYLNGNFLFIIYLCYQQSTTLSNSPNFGIPYFFIDGEFATLSLNLLLCMNGSLTNE